MGLFDKCAGQSETFAYAHAVPRNSACVRVEQMRTLRRELRVWVVQTQQYHELRHSIHLRYETWTIHMEEYL